MRNFPSTDAQALYNLETQLQAAVRDIELLRNDIRSAFDGLDTQARSLSALSARVDTGFTQVSDRITEIDQAHTQQYLDLVHNVGVKWDAFSDRYDVLVRDNTGRIAALEATATEAHARADLALSKVEGIELADVVKRIAMLEMMQHNEGEKTKDAFAMAAFSLEAGRHRDAAMSQRIASLEAAACSSDDACPGEQPSQTDAEARQDYAQWGQPGESMDKYEARRSRRRVTQNYRPERGETITIIPCDWYANNGYKTCKGRGLVRRCVPCGGGG